MDRDHAGVGQRDDGRRLERGEEILDRLGPRHGCVQHQVLPAPGGLDRPDHRVDGGQLGGFGSRFFRERLELRHAFAHAAYGVGVRARHIAQVMQIAREFIGIFAAEQQTYGVRRTAAVAHVLRVEKAGEVFLMPIQRNGSLSRFAAQRFAALADFRRRFIQFRKIAVGFGNGPLRFTQGIGRFIARGFRACHLLLQRLDAATQLLQFFLRGTRVRGCGWCGRSG